jgi:pseudouridine-5'-phosphate glycosidase
MKTHPGIPLSCSEAVSQALESNQPIVALESTVITHGLPYPQNFSLLQRMEAIITDLGAVPATIIVWEGKAHIGIGPKLLDEIKATLSLTQSAFMKLGSRELPLAFARGVNGGTTVSATMLLAQLAGIEVFATGGIGGVHRGWQQSMDISMDLEALSSIPVMVVSQAARRFWTFQPLWKSWRPWQFPSWDGRRVLSPILHSHKPYPSTGVTASIRSCKPGAFIKALQTSSSGMLFANPIPAEHSIPSADIRSLYRHRYSKAAAQAGAHGKALTPFLLDYLARATEGASIRANLALLENNARLAARIARALKDDI